MDGPRERGRKRLWGFDANECLAPILYFHSSPSGKGRVGLSAGDEVA